MASTDCTERIKGNALKAGDTDGGLGQFGAAGFAFFDFDGGDAFACGVATNQA